MGVTYDYTIAVHGNDFIDGEWADEHYHVCDIPVDSKEKAIRYLRGITKEQALEWERESECNALDIIVFADEVDEYGFYTLMFNIVATCEWIGDGLNGIWLGDGIERIG